MIDCIPGPPVEIMATVRATCRDLIDAHAHSVADRNMVIGFVNGLALAEHVTSHPFDGRIAHLLPEAMGRAAEDAVREHYAQVLEERAKALEYTFVMVKPDAVRAGHVDAIRERVGSAGLSESWCHTLRAPRATVEEHYAEHKDKPFYQPNVDFITSGPVFVGVYRGVDAVAKMRRLVGDTDPARAEPGTVRADFGTGLPNNAIHASADGESAQREAMLWSALVALGETGA